ncbi:MAG: hypothetical protein MR884_09415 [Clostridiales bacterium]|jgi:hypothetical protein|nr:hypothetical protein [Clostridiales bacterium]
MALGLLALLVAAVAAISVAGLLLMYLVRSETVKKYIFYIMAVWGMLISVVSAPSLPVNWIFMRAAAWAAGFLGIAGIVVSIAGRTRKHRLYAFLLVTISVVAGALIFIFA